MARPHLFARLRYRFDRLIADGARGKLVVLGLLCLGLLLLGAAAGLIGLFSERNQAVAGVTRELDGGVLDALWWSFHHLLDPSFFAENYGASWPVLAISLLLAVGGMTVFGLLVGFVSAEVEGRLEALRHGDGPVAERGHALVLGWSGRAPAVIAMLARRGTVAVLAPREAQAMREELVAAGLGDDLRRVVLRSGRTDRRADLQRVGMPAARCVIVLPDGGEDASSALALLLCGRRPRVAAEAVQARHAGLLALAGGGQATVVAPAQVVSSLLLQASRQRGLAAVHMRLLDPDGIGFRFIHAPGLDGMPFGDAAFAFPEAVLCGISAAERLPSGGERYLVQLNPSPRRPIQAGDWLVVLAGPGAVAERSGDPGWRKATPAPLTGAEQTVIWRNNVFLSPVAQPNRTGQSDRHQVLVLGWNDAVVDLLEGYDGCRGPAAVVVVVSRLDPEAARSELARRGVALRRIQPRFVNDAMDGPDAVAALAPERYDCVLALSDTEAGGDDCTVLNLIRLRSHLRRFGPATRIVAELADGGKAEAVRALGVEVVVGAEAVGRQLVLVAEQAALAGVFDELQGGAGCEIYLKPTTRYVPAGTACRFQDLVDAAQRLDETALGIMRGDGRIELAPAKLTDCVFADGDRIIVLAEDLLDPEA
jgi:hypothetical protein